MTEKTAYETPFVQRKQIYSTIFFLGTRATGRPRGCCCCCCCCCCCLLLQAWMQYYSQTSAEPPVKSTLHTPDLSSPKQIKNLSNFLSGWRRNWKMQGLFINAMQLQQGSEFFLFFQSRLLPPKGLT